MGQATEGKVIPQRKKGTNRGHARGRTLAGRKERSRRNQASKESNERSEKHEKKSDEGTR